MLTLSKKVAFVVKTANDSLHGTGEHTAYRICKETGVARGSFIRYTQGAAIERMALETAEKLGNYFDTYLTELYKEER